MRTIFPWDFLIRNISRPISVHAGPGGRPTHSCEPYFMAAHSYVFHEFQEFLHAPCSTPPLPWQRFRREVLAEKAILFLLLGRRGSWCSSKRRASAMSTTTLPVWSSLFKSAALVSTNCWTAYTFSFYKHAVYKHAKVEIAVTLSTLLSTPQPHIWLLKCAVELLYL